MSLEEHLSVKQLLDEPSIPISISKSAWISPKLVLIFELDILNNPGGTGDGDAAAAHS